MLLFFAMAFLAPSMGVQHFTPAPGTTHKHVQDIIDFENHWHKYLLSLAGCKTDELKPELCGDKTVPLNMKEWDEARKAAKKLFELGEK